MTFEAGKLVVLPFPYTDLSSSKQRPALVVSPSWYNDASLDSLFAYVTSVEQPEADPFAFHLEDGDIAEGALVKESWIRTDKLFSLEQSLVRKTVATLDGRALEQVRRRIISLARGKDPR